MYFTFSFCHGEQSPCEKDAQERLTFRHCCQQKKASRGSDQRGGASASGTAECSFLIATAVRGFIGCVQATKTAASSGTTQTARSMAVIGERDFPHKRGSATMPRDLPRSSSGSQRRLCHRRLHVWKCSSVFWWVSGLRSIQCFR